ncbi:MAG: hypothetical protein Q4G27_03765 [Flavobacteriaceae bacterium]|nr:hypothetical protein [Flavobacteriaceae bacterium]
MSLSHKLLSEKTGKPFTHCSICDSDLHGKLHFIEKAYHRNLGDHNHSVIFEYAICENCKRGMLQQVSAESLARMQAFMLEHQDEIDEMMHTTTDLEYCSFTGNSLDEMDEYHIVAVVQGDSTPMPPMIFGAAIMEVYQNLLSEKTKEFFDDFYDDFIDIPPELARILDKDFKPVFL